MKWALSISNTYVGVGEGEEEKKIRRYGVKVMGAGECLKAGGKGLGCTCI